MWRGGDKRGFENAQGTLTAGGQTDTSQWIGPLEGTIVTLGNSTLPLQLEATLASAGSATVSCTNVSSSGTGFSVDAFDTRIQAIETSSNQ